MAGIYTRTGDTGTTTHPQEGRVHKSDDVLEVLGLLDEAQVALGSALSWCEQDATDTDFSELTGSLARCMHDLFLCGVASLQETLPTETAWVESEIDRLEKQLPTLRGFIAPGGCELACRLHHARVNVRRLERALWKAGTPPLPVSSFINRLSDYCFVTARYANHLAGYDDSKPYE